MVQRLGSIVYGLRLSCVSSASHEAAYHHKSYIPRLRLRNWIRGVWRLSASMMANCMQPDPACGKLWPSLRPCFCSTGLGPFPPFSHYIFLELIINNVLSSTTTGFYYRKLRSIIDLRYFSYHEDSTATHGYLLRAGQSGASPA
jgi:hypothetical protein